MKVTMMDAVRAHMAAKEMSRQLLPYSLAIALVKVKPVSYTHLTLPTILLV